MAFQIVIKCLKIRLFQGIFALSDQDFGNCTSATLLDAAPAEK